VLKSLKYLYNDLTKYVEFVVVVFKVSDKICFYAEKDKRVAIIEEFV